MPLTERVGGRRRCRKCGSRSLDVVWWPPSSALPPDVAPLAGGAIQEEAHVRWRCRRCGTSMSYDSQSGKHSMWRKRRPLANWLFGR